MKKLLRRIYKNRVGRLFLLTIYLTVFMPLNLVGVGLYYISKLVRALGLLFTGNFFSAKEEMKDWSIEVDLKDVL